MTGDFVDEADVDPAKVNNIRLWWTGPRVDLPTLRFHQRDNKPLHSGLSCLLYTSDAADE